MKLVDKMKDERLGIAILYNFSKGYEKPVPMELYDIVLPFIYHDAFRKEILKHDTLKDVIEASIEADPHFKEVILEAINDDEGITSKALGMAMMGGMLTYEMIDGKVCGKLHEAEVLDFNECIIFGKMMQDHTKEEILGLLHQELRIVFLQVETLGKDVNTHIFDDLGRVTYHENVDQLDVISLCKDADIVIFASGISPSLEGEEMGVNLPGFKKGDRTDIELPAVQRELIDALHRAGKKIILVNCSGSPIGLEPETQKCEAILQAWYPGQQGGKAVAEVLFGDYNPAGRLPLTYYKSLDELPPFDDYDITKGRTYKYFKGDVLYPFGYGLSYSSFTYSDLQVKDGAGEVTVSFRLKNTGKRNGDEVAQVYVRIPETGGIVPLKELKGFRRVPLKSGESRRVEIKLNKEQLRYWDVEKGQFVVPRGAFDIMVGASSKDIRLQTVIDL